MMETQNIEWKEKWHDKYLEWICGFANAEGGRLVIGRDDAGNVVGVRDVKKLLEDIPNKVRD
ncbi:helix-turn-helix domain-containing protein, partial [uncultured Dubosiella sp.]